jgi:cytoskeletal protein CcmA (bactofilin family)
MALWKEQPNTRKDGTDPHPVELAARPETSSVVSDHPAPVEAPRPTKRSEGSESVIGADLAIEGSITGSGSVRLAGRFTGDVTVDGMVTIESGAKLAGSVRASVVAIAGELEGNVVKATRVDVHASGALVGDLKADTLTLAAGSRVRGHIDCGWADTSSSSASSTFTRGGASTPSLSAVAKHPAGSGSMNGAESVAGS